MQTIADILGLVGSFLLVLPPIKHEVRRWRYTAYIKMRAQSREEDELDDAVSEYVVRKSFTWNVVDSICIGGGVVLVCSSFLVRLLM
jgi:hypothetical protein